MAKSMIVFLTILLINLLIVIIYLLWNIVLKKKENKRSFWIRAIVMVLCPVVGVLFFVVSHVLFILFFSAGGFRGRYFQ